MYSIEEHSAANPNSELYLGIENRQNRAAVQKYVREEALFLLNNKRHVDIFKNGSVQFSRNFECTFDKNKPLSLKKEGEARTRSRIFL